MQKYFIFFPSLYSTLNTVTNALYDMIQTGNMLLSFIIDGYKCNICGKVDEHAVYGMELRFKYLQFYYFFIFLNKIIKINDKCTHNII